MRGADLPGRRRFLYARRQVPQRGSAIVDCGTGPGLVDEPARSLSSHPLVRTPYSVTGYSLIFEPRENLRGRDKAGWTQSSQLWQINNDLSLSRRMPRSKPADVPNTERMVTSWRITGWGVLNLSVYVSSLCTTRETDAARPRQSSLTLLKPSSLEPPAWGIPLTDRQVEEGYD